MGTFTLSYCARAMWREYKGKLPLIPVFYYVGHCWTQAGQYKASMMKGQSRMYAHVRESLPKTADPWDY